MKLGKVDFDKMKRCTYCNSLELKEDLKELPYEDSKHLNRRYCVRCYPSVYKDHMNLPWVRKRIEDKFLEDYEK